MTSKTFEMLNTLLAIAVIRWVNRNAVFAMSSYWKQLG